MGTAPRPRRFVLGLLVTGLSFGVGLGCGGSAHPAATAQGSSGREPGAASLTSRPPNDAIVTVDLAGLRAEPRFAKIVEDAEKESEADVGDLMHHVDYVDVRVALHGDEGPPDAVAVVWGHLPKDPREIPAFASGARHAMTPTSPVPASGVVEYVDGETHLFAVSPEAWVVTAGEPTSEVRTHFATHADVPARPSGDLVHMVLTAKAFGKEWDGRLHGIERAEMNLAAGMSTLKAVLSFQDDAKASDAVVQITPLAGLLLGALRMSSAECKALESLDLKVSHAARDVSVELTGIKEASDRWDPVACGKLFKHERRGAEPSASGRVDAEPRGDAALAGDGCAEIAHTKLPRVPGGRRHASSRPAAILKTEITGLENLLQGMQGSKDAPALRHRIALDYAELLAAWGKDCTTRGGGPSAHDVTTAAQRFRALCAENEHDPTAGARTKCE